jgi:4-hydroxy-4-methyl-2-oxoglutarate aldolase
LTDIGGSLLGLGVATLHEALGRRAVSGDVRLLVGSPFAGPACTVGLVAGDNLGIHLAVDRAAAGEVVVAASPGAGRYGVLGDLLLECARASGLAGLVIDDAIRDLGTLTGPPSIAARGKSAHGTVKRRVRSPVGATVAVDGMLVRAGDWIVCDHDGVVVVPAASLDAVRQAAQARADREEQLRQQFIAGASSVQVLHLPVAAAGGASVGRR